MICPLAALAEAWWDAYWATVHALIEACFDTLEAMP